MWLRESQRLSDWGVNLVLNNLQLLSRFVVDMPVEEGSIREAISELAGVVKGPDFRALCGKFSMEKSFSEFVHEHDRIKDGLATMPLTETKALVVMGLELTERVWHLIHARPMTYKERFGISF